MSEQYKSEQYKLQPSHHVRSKLPPDTVFDSVRNFATGTTVASYRRPDLMFVAICTDHGESSPPRPNRTDAFRASRFSQGWCTQCQELLGIEKPEYLPSTASNCQECELCGVYSTKVTAHGHLDSSDVVFACLECRKTEKFKKLYEKRFAEAIQKRREEWKGMSRKERKSAFSRIAAVGGRKGKSEENE